MTGYVSITTGVGSETLTYNGATSNDAHVATAGKYLNAITLGNASDGSGGLASNYQLPTLNVANAPISITPKTVSLAVAPKVYDASTDMTGYVSIQLVLVVRHLLIMVRHLMMRMLQRLVNT